MSLAVTLYDRANTHVAQFPSIKLSVLRYSWRAVGGPYQATVQADGDLIALQRLLDICGYGITVTDELGTPVWWGFVDAVSLDLGGVSVGRSLDDMANEITAIYSDANSSSGAYGVVTLVSDAASVAEYGHKQLRLSSGTSTSSAAANEAARELAARKIPVTTIDPGNGSGIVTATLQCNGAWDVLAWRYYAMAGGREVYADQPDSDKSLGSVAQDAALAQSWTMSVNSPFTISTVEVQMRKLGAPSDNLTLTLCSDSAGNPGASIIASTIGGAGLSTSSAKVSFAFPYTFSPVYGTTYWWKLTRSGAADASNYYFARYKKVGAYSGGIAKVYNGSAWTNQLDTGVTAADFVFSISGVTEAAAFLAALVANYGQYFAGTILETASGMYVPSYGDGSQTHQAAAEQVIQIGTTNARRLLAEVMIDRYVRIYEEPASTDASALLLYDARQNHFYHSGGAPIPDRYCPVARWARLRDLSELASAGELGGLAMLFVEECEYDVESDRLRFSARSQADVYRMGP